MEIKFSDLVLVFATIMGPVLAVQAQKWIERSREKKIHREWIFNTLMATRSSIGRTTPDHVRALNSIILAFKKNKKKEKPIVLAWESYLSHLDTRNLDKANQHEVAIWGEKYDELFIKLLKHISEFLEHDFSDVDIKKGIYVPTAFEDDNIKQQQVRDNLIKFLSGELSCPRFVERLR